MSKNIRDMSREEVQIEIMKFDPSLTDSQAHSRAGKLKRMTQRRDIGFEVGLRILGIIPDPTPREAVRNLGV